MKEENFNNNIQMLLDLNFSQIISERKLEEFLLLPDDMIEHYILINGNRYLEIKRFFDYIINDKSAREVHLGNQLAYNLIIKYNAYDRILKNEKIALAALNSREYDQIFKFTLPQLNSLDPLGYLGHAVMLKTGDMYQIIDEKEQIQEYIYAHFDKSIKQKLDSMTNVDVSKMSVNEFASYIKMPDFLINKSIENNGTNYYNISRKVKYYVNNCTEVNKAYKKQRVRDAILKKGGQEHFLENLNFALTALTAHSYKNIEYKRNRNNKNNSIYGECLYFDKINEIRLITDDCEIKNFIYDNISDNIKQQICKKIAIKDENIITKILSISKRFNHKLSNDDEKFKCNNQKVYKLR